MSFTFDDAFNSSLSELTKYAKLLEKAKDSKTALPHLKLTKIGGQPVLKAVTEKDMGIADKIASHFGWGGYKLAKIVTYLQSEAFSEKLENTRISPENQNAILVTARSLDPLINDYNEHVIFKSSKIKIAKVSLTRTLRDHIKLLSDRTEATAVVILKPGLVVPRDEAKMSFTAASEKLQHASPQERETLLDEVFGFVEKKLLPEINGGLVVVNKEGVLIFGSQDHWYYDFYNNIALKLPPDEQTERLNQILNKATMQQESRKLHTWTDESDPFFKAYLEKLCTHSGKSFPTKEYIVQSQLKMLSDFFAKPESFQMSPSDFRREIGVIKIRAYAIAHGIPVNNLNLIFRTMGALQERQAAILNLVDVYHKGLEQDPAAKALPPLAKEATFMQIWGLCLELYDDLVKSFVEKCGSRLIDGTLSVEEQNRALSEFSNNKIEERLRQFIQNKVEPPLAFYRKWEKYLTWEMMQGFRDPNEALGEGVCYGISVRWAKEEFNNESPSTLGETIGKMDVTEITPSDRFLQAKRNVATDYSAGISDQDLLEDFKFAEKLSGSRSIRNTLQSWIQDPEFQSKFRGTGKLSFRGQGPFGHAITITFQQNPNDPTKSIFRVRDANIGMVQIPVEGDDLQAMKDAQNRCLDYLVDLIITYYGENLETLACTCPVQASHNEMTRGFFDQTHQVLQYYEKSESSLTDVELQKELQQIVQAALLRAKRVLAEEVAQGMISLDSKGKLQIPEEAIDGRITKDETGNIEVHPQKHWFHTFLKHRPEYESYLTRDEKAALLPIFKELSFQNLAKEYFEVQAMHLERLAKEKSSLLVLKRIQALEDAYDMAQKFLEIEKGLGVTHAAWFEAFKTFIYEQASKIPHKQKDRARRLLEKLRKEP